MHKDRGISQRSEFEGNGERVVETFIDLVTIDSPTGSEQAISDYLVNHFSKRGIEVVQDTKRNVLAKIPGVGEPLLFAAHMDTVEPGTTIRPQIVDGVLKSSSDTILGADNKSTIAVLLETVDRLREGHDVHRPLELLFTVDEEQGNTGAAEFDYSQITARKGLIADIALPLGTIVIASPAYIGFEAYFVGRAGHAAFPENAHNVTDAVATALLMEKGQLDPDTTRNIGKFEAGTTRNTIPGAGYIMGEIRSYDEEHLAHHLQQTVAWIRRAAKKFGVGVDLDHRKDNPGYVFAETDPYIEIVADHLKSFGLSVNLMRSPSVSDANIFNAKGLQVVNIGDGTMYTHSTNEQIKIADMTKLVDIFYRFAKK